MPHLHEPRHAKPARSTAILFAAALALATSLTACGQAQDAASSAAQKAGDKAGAAVQQQTKEQVVTQLCVLVGKDGSLADGKISERERPAVASIAGVAEKAGVSRDYTDPLKAMASDAGAKATAKAIDTLTKACAARS